MGIVSKIGELEQDLSTEIVVQEEKRHYEDREFEDYVLDSRWTWGSTPIREKYTESVKVIVQPEITEPDEQKRQAARTELQKICDESKWYQLVRKYLVRKALKR